MANFKLASGRTLRQWQVCEPRRMVSMSPAAIEYALMDAQVDIMALASRIKRAIALAEEGMCHGLLADEKCREILEVLRMPEDGSFDHAADESERDAAPIATQVDTTPGEAEFMLQLFEAAGHITPELIAKARHLARLACAATDAGNAEGDSNG